MFIKINSTHKNDQQVLSSSWDGRPFGHNRHGPKIGRLCPFWEGELGPHVTQCGLAEAYLRTKWHLDQSSSLTSRNLVEGLFPFRVELGPHLTQCCPGQGQGLPSYQVASWSMQPFGHNRQGLKIGGALPSFWSGGAGSPSNTTMSLGSKPTSIPSGIMIHSAVWAQ